MMVNYPVLRVSQFQLLKVYCKYALLTVLIFPWINFCKSLINFTLFSLSQSFLYMKRKEGANIVEVKILFNHKKLETIPVYAHPV